jgi:predicted Zn-dependent protease
MNGKADEALVILEEALSKDSTNALAWYELARTKHHMGLGNIQVFVQNLDDMEQTIEKAILADPDNVIYTFYKGYISCMRWYISLMMGSENSAEDLTKVKETFNEVLSLKPDYHEARLYLVEILGNLPDSLGGDRAKAEGHIHQLEKEDAVYAARAKELIMPWDADRVAFWKGIPDNYKANAEVLTGLGKAYMYNIDECRSYFNRAVEADPEKDILYLDLARYLMMNSQEENGFNQDKLSLAFDEFSNYLDKEPIRPLQAFSYSLMARIKQLMGDQDEMNNLLKKAEAADSYFSKAFGTPPLVLFTPPTEIAYYHGSFFRPY